MSSCLDTYRPAGLLASGSVAETLPALVHSASLLPPGPRSLAGSAPVTIPGSLPRSPSLHSSSSLSTSPLSSLSQSLSGPLVSSAMTPPQQPPPLRSEPATLGSAASSYSSLGACLGVGPSPPALGPETGPVQSSPGYS